MLSNESKSNTLRHKKIIKCERSILYKVVGDLNKFKQLAMMESSWAIFVWMCPVSTLLDILGSTTLGQASFVFIIIFHLLWVESFVLLHLCIHIFPSYFRTLRFTEVTSPNNCSNIHLSFVQLPEISDGVDGQ